MPKLIQYACTKRVAMSRETKVWLWSLFDTKDISNSGDNETIETMTFIADDEGKFAHVNEGVQATRVFANNGSIGAVACTHML